MQDFVQAFISGSSMIFVPCCIFTHTPAHLFSSTEWHMQRQHRPPGVFVGSCGEAPVTDDETRTMTNTADKTLRITLIHLALGFIAGRRFEKAPNAYRILLLRCKTDQITVVMAGIFRDWSALRPIAARNSRCRARPPFLKREA
jgi:hypothetical protein